MNAPRDEVYFDASAVSAATPAEKHHMLGSIVHGILRDDVMAGNTALSLGLELTDFDRLVPLPSPETAEEDRYQQGALPPAFTLALAKDLPRLRGFIRAISRWDRQELIMDVGCGAFPTLALAAALYHPEAEIQAVEIHPVTAESAAAIVDLFGLGDRLQVVNANISNHAIDPNTSAAVTETFNVALTGEPGPQIVRLLHASGVPTITPSNAELRLQVGDAAFTQGIDLRTDSRARIVIDGTDFDPDPSAGAAHITAAYGDDNGLFLDHGESSISCPQTLGRFSGQVLRVLASGETGVLTYNLGERFQPELLLHAELPG